MRCRNEHVLKMHWTFEAGRDRGRGVLCVHCIRGAVALRRAAVMECVVRRFAPENF
jgi:hypothetical protein